MGAHAYQVLLYERTRKGDAQAFSSQGLTPAQLRGLAAAHEALAASDPVETAKWVEGKSSTFDAADALEPLVQAPLVLDARLPVSVATAFFAARDPDMPPERVRVLANLLQVVLEIRRDEGTLQSMFRFYLPLGLLAGPQDFGIDDDNVRFLELGTELAGRSCPAPFDTGKLAWQIALRKVQNWNLEYRGILGPREYAEELLARDDIKPLIPKIRAMPRQLILVLGHSFTLKLHWSTHAPMNEVVAAVFAGLNPSVRFAHMGHGSTSASQARERLLQDALAMRPNRVLLVVLISSDADFAAIAEITRTFRRIGAEVMCFDQLHTNHTSWINPDRARLAAVAARSGLTVIEVGRLIDTHPQKNDFVSLDGVHMRPPFHKFMAGELLKYLLGVRGAKLPHEKETQE